MREKILYQAIWSTCSWWNSYTWDSFKKVITKLRCVIDKNTWYSNFFSNEFELLGITAIFWSDNDQCICEFYYFFLYKKVQENCIGDSHISYLFDKELWIQYKGYCLIMYHYPLIMQYLIESIWKCQICTGLPLGIKPIISVSPRATLLIIGQAPGIKVHRSGIPWDDPSGERLREWLHIDRGLFYDAHRVGIMPMGFCYPGTGKSWDIPPRKECAPLWHQKVIDHMPDLKPILLIGQYAQKYYLSDSVYPTLTETVKNYTHYLPKYFVLPHPSPRNNIWMKKNPWFVTQVLPKLQKSVREVL